MNGAIGAKDVIVTNTGWSDYVFQPGPWRKILADAGLLAALALASSLLIRG